jgi:hypothetical protein
MTPELTLAGREGNLILPEWRQDRFSMYAGAGGGNTTLDVIPQQGKIWFVVNGDVWHNSGSQKNSSLYLITAKNDVYGGNAQTIWGGKTHDSSARKSIWSQTTPAAWAAGTDIMGLQLLFPLILTNSNGIRFYVAAAAAGTYIYMDLAWWEISTELFARIMGFKTLRS